MSPSVTRLAGNGQTCPYVTVAGCVGTGLGQGQPSGAGRRRHRGHGTAGLGVGHRRGRHRCGSRRPSLASQLAVGWVNDWLDADRDRAVGRTDKPVATGAIDRRTVGIAAPSRRWLASRSGLLFRAGRRARLHDLGAGLRAALRLAAEVHRAVSSLPYAVSFGLLPAFVVLGAAGLAGARRSGWWRPARCSGPAPTSPTCCPTSTTTPAPAYAGCRTGSARTGSAVAAAGCCSRPRVALVFGPPGPPVVGRHRRDRRRRRGAAARVVRRPARDRPRGPAGRGLPRGDGGGADRRRPARDELTRCVGRPRGLVDRPLPWSAVFAG